MDSFGGTLDPDGSGRIQFESKFSSSVPIVIAYISHGELLPLLSTVEASIKDQPTITFNPNHFYNPKYLSKVKYAFAGQSTPGTNVLKLKQFILGDNSVLLVCFLTKM